MRRFALILPFLLGCPAGFCFAQEGKLPFFPDRPGVLTGTGIMPRHKIQVETGMGFESNTGGPFTWSLNETQIRFGLFETAEIRLGTEFVMVKDTPDARPVFGMEPLCLELKARFYEGAGVFPSVGLLIGLDSSHIGSKWLLPTHLTPTMLLLFEQDLSDRFALCYNAGVQWDGESPTPTTLLGIGLSCDITERFGTFVESYNYLHPDRTNQYMTEFGLAWLVSDRVQLDLAADLDLGHLGHFFALNFGICWLIN